MSQNQGSPPANLFSSFGHSPQFGQFVTLFLDVKNNVLTHITEQSKDDVSDNFDHNFGTFDDFGVKNDQKVSNNMILMSKYKGKHGGKKSKRGMPERKRFFL